MANSRIVNTPAQALAQGGTTHKQVTVGNTAGDLLTLGSFSIDKLSTHILMQVTGASIRVTFDGVTDPTPTKGFDYPLGTMAYWPRELFLSARCIAESGTPAVLEIQELNYR